jgi:hypothetical protein
MAREAGVGDFECDCGHHSSFFENTIREMAALSLKRGREVRLGSAAFCRAAGRGGSRAADQDARQEHEYPPDDDLKGG